MPTVGKFGIPLLLVVGITVGHSGYRIYLASDAAHRDDVRGRLRIVAAALGTSMEPDMIEALRAPTDLDHVAYRELLAQMRRAALGTEIAWVGVFRELDGHLHMVADLGETGVGYPFFYATEGHWTALREGRFEDVDYTDEFGSYVGHVAPILGEDGTPIAIVEASVHRDLLELFARQEGSRVLRSLAVATAVAMFLVLLLTAFVVERPLQRLRHGVAMLSQGNFDHTLKVHGHDEFAQLADAFNRMAADLKKLYGGLEGVVQARTRSLEAKNAELQKALQQLKDAQELLLQREKMAAVGQLVSGVAHELNNPLAGIQGYAQICMERTDDPRQRRSLDKICAEVKRAAGIVRNLLTFSRKSAGDVHYIDVNEVVRRTLELRASHLRGEEIEVDSVLAPGPLRTLANFHQLQQVLLNILTNAAHAVRGRNGGGHITVRTGSDGDRIQVHVADNGAGIPAENLGRLFDPFFTTKEVGEGTGLGLSICFGIVRQHNGTIRAANLPDGGAEFLIELPIVLGTDPLERTRPIPTCPSGQPAATEGSDPAGSSGSPVH